MSLFFRKNKLLVSAFIFQAIITYQPSNILAQNTSQKTTTQPQAEVFEIKEKDLPQKKTDSVKGDIPLPDFKEFEDDKYINEILGGQPGQTKASSANTQEQPPTAQPNTPVNAPPVTPQANTATPGNNSMQDSLDDILMSPAPDVAAPPQNADNTNTTPAPQDTPTPPTTNVEIPQNKENLLTTDINNKKKDALTEDEKQAYQQLKTHLSDFITSFHKGGASKENDIAQEKPAENAIAQNQNPPSAPITPQESPPAPINDTKQENSLDKTAPANQANNTTANNHNEFMDDLLGIAPTTPNQNNTDTPAKNEQNNSTSGNIEAEKKDTGSPIKQPIPATPVNATQTPKEPDILANELKVFNKDLGDKDIETIKAKLGNCAQYALNLKECKAFSCSYQENNLSIVKNISGWQDKKCATSEIVDNKPGSNCQIPEKSIKDFYEYNMLKTANKNLTKKQEENLNAINKANCNIKAQETQLVKQQPGVKPVEIDEEPESQPEPMKLSEADKAYLKLLDKQSQALPEGKRLSPSTKEAVSGIASSIMPKQQNKEPSYIRIERSKQSDVVIDDASKEKSKKKIDITVSNKKDNEDTEKTKVKLERAYKALMVGQMAAAINIYKEVLAREPVNKDALFGLATSYHKNSQFEQARTIYTQILKKYPNEKEALNNYLVLVAEEAPQDALIELEKLERINSDFSPIPAQIAMIHLKLGDTEKAVRYLRRAILLSPENITYKYNLAITYDRTGKVDSAIQLYRQILVEVEEKGAVIPGSIDKVNERLKYLESKAEGK